MQRAATTQTTQHSSKRTTDQSSAPVQIRSTQVWQQLSPTQQQALQRTLASVCRSLANHLANEEVHDDRS